jgi:hypothetical protein
MSEFYKYFKENMDGLGLPTPENLFGTSQSAVSTASTLLGLIDRFGKDKNVGELLSAGTKGGKLAVLSTINASFYVGAVIGSIAVATGRNLAGGTSLADVLLEAQMNQLHRPWLASILVRHPKILKRRKITPFRRAP